MSGRSEIRRSRIRNEAIMMAFTVAVFFTVWRTTDSITYAILAAAVVFCIGLGVLIALLWWKLEKARRVRIGEIDQMEEKEFEGHLQSVFKLQGYKVEQPNDGGSFGADFILVKDGRRVAVQAKRYTKQVGVPAVQQVAAAIKHYRADEGWVIANREYSGAARKLASSNGIKLHGREQLIELILSVQGAAPAGETAVKE